MVLLLCMGTISPPLLGQQAVPTVQFTNNPTLASNAGHTRLAWQTAGANGNSQAPITYEVQQASTPGFEHAKLLYRGPDVATFVSGLPNGTYYYRVRSAGPTINGPWSATVQLTVQHHSLQLTYLLMALGGTVFLMTVALIIRGSKQQPS